MLTASQRSALDDNGWAVLPELLTEPDRLELVRLFDESRDRAGRRDGLRSPFIRELAGSDGLMGLARSILGAGTQAVKATLFGKSAAANWLVPWHQDLTIPIQSRNPADGFEGWSVKGGIPHARAPRKLLESMIAIRLDLDGSTAENGALRVLPGTHQEGVLDQAKIAQLRTRVNAVTCTVPSRGGLILRPLLLHASSRTREPSNRRVLHVEYACAKLPRGLNWLDWEQSATS